MKANNSLTIPEILALHRAQLGTMQTSAQQQKLERLPLVLNYLVGIGKADAGTHQVNLLTAWQKEWLKPDDFMSLHDIQVPTGAGERSIARPLLNRFDTCADSPVATLELSVGFRRASDTDER